MKTKPCSRCKIIKNISDFSKDKQHSSGYKSACKVCAKQDWITWRTVNLESARKTDRISHYVRKYGLSIEEATALVEDRTGLCKICANIVPLVVDHCHISGLVRGLICSSCNSVLGYSKDNINTLKASIKYLEDFYGNSKLV